MLASSCGPWRQQAPTQTWRSSSCATAASRRVATAAVLRNPSRILGVDDHADLAEIKKAYRKLALQHHPDINKEPGAEVHFLAITEAYELLVGRHRGKEDTDHSSSNSWDFHDWYWNFRMQRSWDRQAAGDRSPRRPHHHNAAAFQQPERREAVQSQLAGLRHRAAVRAQKTHPQQVHPQQAGSYAAMQAAPTHAAQDLLACPHDAALSAHAVGHGDSAYAAAQAPLTPPLADGYPVSPPFTASDTTPASSWSSVLIKRAEDQKLGDGLYPPTHATLVDGHFGTPIYSNAVPFNSAMFTRDLPPAHHKTQHSHAAGAEPRKASDAAAALPSTCFAADANGTAQHYPPEAAAAQTAAPQAHPAEGGGEADTAGKTSAHARRPFVTTSERRESVAQQLSGLRRKAALKATAAASMGA